jgi:hypothetical protein
MTSSTKFEGEPPTTCSGHIEVGLEPLLAQASQGIDTLRAGKWLRSLSAACSSSFCEPAPGSDATRMVADSEQISDECGLALVNQRVSC